MIDETVFIQIDKLKEQLESYKEQCTGNHSDPEDCPTWHDWCNCGGFLAEHIQQLKEQLEWEVSLKKALLERQEEWAKGMRDLKKEIIKLKSLNRRAAEEIRDLDNHLIKLVNECEGAAKVIDYDIDAESDGYWSGMSSINLLNRLDGRTNGGYIEHYEDLYLELKKLENFEQSKTRVVELIELYEEGKYAEFTFGTGELEPEELLEVAPLLKPAMKKLRERDEN